MLYEHLLWLKLLEADILLSMCVIQEHGMRPLPTANYPDKIEGLTLKCTRKQETVRF